MNPPPILRDQRQKDAEHLRLLALFHFIAAGLGVVALGFLYFQYRFTEGNMNYDAVAGAKGDAAESIQFFIRFFKTFYLVLGGMDVLCAIGNVASGFCIRRRKYRTFSLIIAGLNCVRLSLGTVLGVFTFIVLLRKSVREMYNCPGDATPGPSSDPTPISDLRTPISVAPPAQPAPASSPISDLRTPISVAPPAQPPPISVAPSAQPSPMPLIRPSSDLRTRTSVAPPAQPPPTSDPNSDLRTPISVAPPAQPPPISAAEAAQGDATGGIIPYKNPPALIAYYCGIFSVIPFFGFFIGIAALWLGIVGLRKRKQTPVIKGSVHAWIGIIVGSLSILAHVAVVAMIFNAGRR